VESTDTMALPKKFYDDWRNHHGLEAQYEAGLKDLKDPVPDIHRPGKTITNPWKHINGDKFDYLFKFLEKWYLWTPGGATDGLDYIVEFSWISYLNNEGIAFTKTSYGAAMLADFTELQGEFMDSPESKDKIKEVAKGIGQVRMDDYVDPEKPKPEWPTFNEFFIREIRKEARPVYTKKGSGAVVAPADCVINMIVDGLTLDTPLQVKNVQMSVSKLLNDSHCAKYFNGGTAVSCILMPDGYHWYHAPVGGEVVESHDDIGGVYYGMANFPELLNKGNVGYGYDYEMFTDFRRGYLIIETQYYDVDGNETEKGYVGMVTVGLNSIGSVNYLDKFADIKPEDRRKVPIEAGEKIGNFKYGGSLNILLFQEGRFPAVQLLQGQRIGVLEDPNRSTNVFGRSYYSLTRQSNPLAR
jgi:phosphatidylserine decarboxylase